MMMILLIKKFKLDNPDQQINPKADNSWIWEIASSAPPEHFSEQIRDNETKKTKREKEVTGSSDEFEGFHCLLIGVSF